MLSPLMSIWMVHNHNDKETTRPTWQLPRLAPNLLNVQTECHHHLQQGSLQQLQFWTRLLSVFMFVHPKQRKVSCLCLI